MSIYKWHINKTYIVFKFRVKLKSYSQTIEQISISLWIFNPCSLSELVLWFFFWSFFSSLLEFGSLLVKLHQLCEIELGFLYELNLLEENVLDWEDLWALLLDLFANWFLDKFLGKFLESRLLYLIHHDLHHLLSNLLSLGSLGIAGSLDLLAGSFGEANSEHS